MGAAWLGPPATQNVVSVIECRTYGAAPPSGPLLIPDVVFGLTRESDLRQWATSQGVSGDELARIVAEWKRNRSRAYAQKSREKKRREALESAQEGARAAPTQRDPEALAGNDADVLRLPSFDGL